METSSVSLALCARNPPVISVFLSQKANNILASISFFTFGLNKVFSTHSRIAGIWSCVERVLYFCKEERHVMSVIRQGWCAGWCVYACEMSHRLLSYKTCLDTKPVLYQDRFYSLTTVALAPILYFDRFLFSVTVSCFTKRLSALINGKICK